MSLEMRLRFGNHYATVLGPYLDLAQWDNLIELAGELRQAWSMGRQVFLCGNGGSAANAEHIANDLLYGIGAGKRIGLRAIALTANTAALTCLANDIGYDEVFAYQIRVYAPPGDVLVALSGSGNSKNILKALEQGNSQGVETFAILGYDGGRAKDIAKHPIHCQVDDMQIAEDLQLMIGHMLMQWLRSNPPAGVFCEDAKFR